jgi:hypothetical protein
MSKKAATATQKPAAKKSTKKQVATIGISGSPDVTKPAKQPSNKERVYRQWEKADDKSPKQAEALMAKAKVEGIQLNTVRGWLSAWNNGKNLPGCAKE